MGCWVTMTTTMEEQQQHRQQLDALPGQACCEVTACSAAAAAAAGAAEQQQQRRQTAPTAAAACWSAAAAATEEGTSTKRAETACWAAPPRAPTAACSAAAAAACWAAAEGAATWAAACWEAAAAGTVETRTGCSGTMTATTVRSCCPSCSLPHLCVPCCDTAARCTFPAGLGGGGGRHSSEYYAEDEREEGLLDDGFIEEFEELIGLSEWFRHRGCVEREGLGAARRCRQRPSQCPAPAPSLVPPSRRRGPARPPCRAVQLAGQELRPLPALVPAAREPLPTLPCLPALPVLPALPAGQPAPSPLSNAERAAPACPANSPHVHHASLPRFHSTPQVYQRIFEFAATALGRAPGQSSQELAIDVGGWLVQWQRVAYVLLAAWGLLLQCLLGSRAAPPPPPLLTAPCARACLLLRRLRARARGG